MKRPSPIQIEEQGPLREAADWCMAMAEAELTPGQEAKFRAWCETSDANLEAFETVARAWRAVGQTASSPAMLGMRRAALDNLERARAFRWRRSPVWNWVGAAACAMVVLAAAAAFFLLEPRTYQTGLGERRVITLADGSRVSMDGATRVRVLYADGRRQFWLDNGRAKFSVAKDPLHPFTVSAGGEIVVATGTQFSVELLRQQVRVALYEGHVTVWRASTQKGVLQPVMADGKVAEQNLTPGRELVAAAGAPTGQIVDTDPVRSLSWEAGQLVFDNELLASAVERVNRYAAQPVHVTEAAGREIRVSGVFVAGDTDAFVEGVVSLFPLRAVRTGDVVTLEVDHGRLANRPLDATPLG